MPTLLCLDKPTPVSPSPECLVSVPSDSCNALIHVWATKGKKKSTRHVMKTQECIGCIRWQDGNSVPPKCRQQKRRPWIWRFDISHRPPAPPGQLRERPQRLERDVPRHKPHFVPSCGQVWRSTVNAWSILLDRLPPSHLDAGICISFSFSRYARDAMRCQQTVGR